MFLCRLSLLLILKTDDLKRFQQLLLVKHNTFAPVNVLPPEVLAHCFRFISLKQLIKGAVDPSLDIRLRTMTYRLPNSHCSLPLLEAGGVGGTLPLGK